MGRRMPTVLRSQNTKPSNGNADGVVASLAVAKKKSVKNAKTPVPLVDSELIRHSRCNRRGLRSAVLGDAERQDAGQRHHQHAYHPEFVISDELAV